MEFTGAQLQYLDHLGIDVWVPREQSLQQASVPSQVDQVNAAVNDVTHAAPQTGVAQHQASTASSAQNIEAKQAPVPNSSKQSQAETARNSADASAASSEMATNVENIKAATGINPISPMAAAPAYPGGELKAAQQSTTANESPAKANAPEFNLQFWCYGSGLWLVNGHVNIQPEHHKLVHNIAHYLQGKKTKPRHVGIFSWPMLDAPNIDQGPEVATKHLKDHIHRLQEISTVKKLVVFTDDDDWFAHLNPVKISTTLDDLLTNPEHKKNLWKTLIPHRLTD